MEWEAYFHALRNTNRTDDYDYPANFSITQYSVNQNEGGAMHYQGELDPSTTDFGLSQDYSGNTVSTTQAAENLKKQLKDYLTNHQDDRLQNILDDLNQQIFQSQALSGLNASLIMQAQALQLKVDASSNNPYFVLTQAIAPIVGTHNTVAPTPNSYYNPIRAGFMKLAFMLIDRYGQKRAISLDKLICAQSLTPTFQGTEEQNSIHLPPRIAQPSRLIFRWLAAVGEELQEMNAYPATTLVCGWILPSHLRESLFLYDQQGKALATMFLNGDQSKIIWQSAPGDNTTTNQSVETIFQYQDPSLVPWSKHCIKELLATLKLFGVLLTVCTTRLMHKILKQVITYWYS